MWPDAGPTMTEAEFRAWQRKRLPPDNEMPRVMALDADLLRTPDRAVTLTHCLLYSRGASFRFTALFRVQGEGSLDGDDQIAAAIMPGAGRRNDFVLGVALADGTELRSPVGEAQAGPYLMRHSPEAAHMSGLRTALWLTPLPPAGALTFSVECPSLGIEPAAATVDAAGLRDAARAVTALWDWDD